MSRTRHTSQTTKVNTVLKVQTFSTRMERESIWHYGIAVDPGLLGNVTPFGVTVGIDNRFENFAAILLSSMLGDPYFSFRRSLPFLILSISTKNKKSLYVKIYKYFAFYALARPRFSFFNRLYVSFFKVYFTSDIRHQLQKFVYLY